MLERMLKSKFGESNVVKLDQSTDNIAEPSHYIIHVPEVEIKNKHGNSHKIRGLLCRIIALELEDGSFKPQNIDGTRIIFSYAEEHSNYLHSHLKVKTAETILSKLNSNSEFPFESKKHPFYESFGRFCLGNSPLSVSMDTELPPISGVGQCMAFVNSLSDLFCWESLDGGPHIKMSSIVDPRMVPLEISKNPWTYRIYLEILIRYSQIRQGKPYLSYRGVKGFELSRELSEYLDELAQERNPEWKKLGIWGELHDGQVYAEIPRYSVYEDNLYDSLFGWKAGKYSDREISESDEVAFNPKAKYRIQNLIETRLNELYVDKNLYAF